MDFPLRFPRPFLHALLGAGLVLTLSACGSDSPDDGDDSDGGPLSHSTLVPDANAGYTGARTSQIPADGQPQS